MTETDKPLRKLESRGDDKVTVFVGFGKKESVNCCCQTVRIRAAGRRVRARAIESRQAVEALIDNVEAVE